MTHVLYIKSINFGEDTWVGRGYLSSFERNARAYRESLTSEGEGFGEFALDPSEWGLDTLALFLSEFPGERVSLFDANDTDDVRMFIRAAASEDLKYEAIQEVVEHVSPRVATVVFDDLINFGGGH